MCPLRGFLRSGGLEIIHLERAGLAALSIHRLSAEYVKEHLHEIGIRKAMGASTHDVLALVLKPGLGVVLAGTGLGVILAIVGTRMSALLSSLGPADPLTYLIVTSLLTVVALGAGYIPAWKATRLDPLLALRYE